MDKELFLFHLNKKNCNKRFWYPVLRRISSVLKIYKGVKKTKDLKIVGILSEVMKYFYLSREEFLMWKLLK